MTDLDYLNNALSLYETAPNAATLIGLMQAADRLGWKMPSLQTWWLDDLLAFARQRCGQ